jgi:hypothetical protein
MKLEPAYSSKPRLLQFIESKVALNRPSRYATKARFARHYHHAPQRRRFPATHRRHPAARTLAAPGKSARLLSLGQHAYPVGMIKTGQTGKRISLGKRSFRRWVRRLFSGWTKLQNGEIEKIFEKLRDIEDSIEIIAREIVRQARRGKR